MENAPEHSATLWKWANAYSLEGGSHSDRPALERAAGDARGSGQASGAGRAAPDGSTSSFASSSSRRRSRTRSARCGSRARHRSRRRASPRSRRSTPSARARSSRAPRSLIGRQMMPDQGEVQHEDPAADHYVSIRSSNPGRALEQAPRSVRRPALDPQVQGSTQPRLPARGRQDRTGRDRHRDVRRSQRRLARLPRPDLEHRPAACCRSTSTSPATGCSCRSTGPVSR